MSKAKNGIGVRALEEIASRNGAVMWLRSGLVENLELSQKTKTVYASSEHTKPHPIFGGNTMLWECQEVSPGTPHDMERLGPRLPQVLAELTRLRKERRKIGKAAALRRKLQAEKQAVAK